MQPTPHNTGGALLCWLRIVVLAALVMRSQVAAMSSRPDTTTHLCIFGQRANGLPELQSCTDAATVLCRCLLRAPVQQRNADVLVHAPADKWRQFFMLHLLHKCSNVAKLVFKRSILAVH